jgi:F-type H+-transporting ATPase subunit gamma
MRFAPGSRTKALPNRRDIKGRIATLREINGILAAMKNLALMELQKLGRFIGMQRRVTQSIEAATADFLTFYPGDLPAPGNIFEVYLLVGSERGFCGDFNETVIDAFRKSPPTFEPGVVAVGRRLAGKLSGAVLAANVIEGAGIAEEVEAVLTRLVELLSRLLRERGRGYLLGLTALYHDHETEAINVRRLLPMPDLPRPAREFSFPPLLNFAPVQLLPKLVDQYLYAVLHEVLYSSLLAENQRRLTHMDSAMRRIENDLAQLGIKYNALRQEEIIEEIEVILLSAEAIAAD